MFFSYFSGLKPNLTNSEIAGTGVLKGVQVAVCGMHCIKLNADAWQLLGTHLPYNENVKDDKRFCNFFIDIKLVLKETIEGKIVIFKAIAISKIVFQAFITTVP